MFGWQSPGQKYSQTIINQWLETENELVRDRITQLFDLKNNPHGCISLLQIDEKGLK